jgi:hypothetical protein
MGDKDKVRNFGISLLVAIILALGAGYIMASAAKGGEVIVTWLK